jgi:hypothetical protein
MILRKDKLSKYVSNPTPLVTASKKSVDGLDDTWRLCPLPLLARPYCERPDEATVDYAARAIIDKGRFEAAIYSQLMNRVASLRLPIGTLVIVN